MNRIGKLALIVIIVVGQDCESWALRAAGGIVRVDLQKDLVQRSELSAFADDEKILLSDAETDVNYAQLRSQQNDHIQKSYALLSNKQTTTGTSSESESNKEDEANNDSEANQ